MNGPHHHLHNDYEPVLSRGSYDLPPPDGADSQRRTVRKVAAGPPVSSYKGTLLKSPRLDTRVPLKLCEVMYKRLGELNKARKID